MKHLFLAAAVLITLGGTALHLTEPDVRSELPVIYWTIDPNPSRSEQIALFHLWQIKNGHGQTWRIDTMDELAAFRRRHWTAPIIKAVEQGNPDGPKVWSASTSKPDLPLTIRVPACEMRVDAANNDGSKKLIQGVSGVAGDVIEIYGAKGMRYFADIGLLADVTGDARRLGFGPDQTFPARQPGLLVDGRQFGFVRNVSQNMYWVNKATFEAHGQPLPPTRWTIEEFERLGRQFVAAANRSGQRQRVFFANRVMKEELRRSRGLEAFNETLTRSTLDDPRHASVLERIYQWTFKERILPSAADRASFDTAGGWGGPDFQLFNSGQYAMFASGRWALCLFRKFGAMQLAVVEPPHAGMPNTVLYGGQSAVYVNSPHRDCAVLFMAYLASEEYNMQIVRDGDALPPNPAYCRNEAYLRPAAFPNEWGCHEAFLRDAMENALPQSICPYIVATEAEWFEQYAEDQVMNNLATPQRAVAECARRINESIDRRIAQDSRLRASHEKWSAIQAQIDQRCREGRPVPAEWLANPFHRDYYRRMGWLESPATQPAGPGGG